MGRFAQGSAAAVPRQGAWQWPLQSLQNHSEVQSPHHTSCSGSSGWGLRDLYFLREPPLSLTYLESLPLGQCFPKLEDVDPPGHLIYYINTLLSLPGCSDLLCSGPWNLTFPLKNQHSTCVVISSASHTDMQTSFILSKPISPTLPSPNNWPGVHPGGGSRGRPPLAPLAQLAPDPILCPTSGPTGSSPSQHHFPSSFLLY